MIGRRISLIIGLIALLALGLPLGAQSTGAPQLPIDEVIRRFSANESLQREARRDYSFQQKAVIQTLGFANQITGEFHRVSDVVFDDSSKRVEKIVYFPAPTLTEVQITKEDLADLSGIQPFALVKEELHKYNIRYVGKEKIDELNTYVFEVEPKHLPNPKKSSERFLKGRIWVDDIDFVIVKVAGKGVPEGDQRFPHFETYREHIDGKFWFPTYTYSDDHLTFKDGNTVHLRMVINYTNYKKFTGDIQILDGEIESPK